MEAAFAILSGLFFAAAIYLMLSKHIIRVLLGIAVLGNAVNLLIFAAGRLSHEAPALIPEGQDVPVPAIANALPQALILTAIVISFSFFCFLLVLAYRTFQDLGTDDTDGMRVAEPREQNLPPMGY